MSQRVLVTGASGYLGQFLLDEILKLKGKGAASFEVAGTYSARAEGLPAEVQAFKVDFQDESSVTECVKLFKPDFVINLAAVSSPAACEKNKNEAWASNAPGSLLRALKEVNPEALFVQLSTDQIFDGDNAPYKEDASANPVNEYGKSKLAFEKTLREEWPAHIILRSSLIYGPPPPRPCARSGSFLQFLDSSLGSNSADEKPVDLFSDEVRCAIYVNDVVNILVQILLSDRTKVCKKTSSEGGHTFNMGGPDRLSRIDMGVAVCKVRGYPESRMVGIKRADLNLGFQSPLDICMDSTKMQDEEWYKKALPQGMSKFEDAAKIVLSL